MFTAIKDRAADGFFRLLGEIYLLFMQTLASNIQLEVKDKEKLPRSGYILCPNHNGHLDGIFLYRVLGRGFPRDKRCSGLARTRPDVSPLVKRIWLSGRVLLLFEGKSNIKAIREAVRSLREDKSLVFFPDRRKGGVYRGAAFLACQSNLPIVPLRIAGGGFVDRQIPPYAFPFAALREYRKRGGKVTLTFMDPIAPDPVRYRTERKRYLDALTRELGEKLGLGEVNDR
ncbi:MAG: 1-acyl-sn-glycerol-3-phosphate acyltransferase [Candidatus Rokubacteria bacterium]|nr:1-acyl-sn-glycerol-3-phosphate acyltransferase [Candidatus Rokubacteria bacterium]